MKTNSMAKMNIRRRFGKLQTIWLTVFVLFALVISSLNLRFVVASEWWQDDDVYIGGVAMLSGYYMSENDTTQVTATAPVGGYAYYDGDTRTLTLNNFDYTGTQIYTNSISDTSLTIRSAIRVHREDISIKLVGTNNITSSSYADADIIAGIECIHNQLKFIGDGTLNVTAGDNKRNTAQTAISCGIISGITTFSEYVTVISRGGNTNYQNPNESGSYSEASHPYASCQSAGLRTYGLTYVKDFAKVQAYGGDSHKSYGYLGDSLYASGSGRLESIGGYGIEISAGVAGQDLVAEDCAFVYGAGGIVDIGNSVGIYSETSGDVDQGVLVEDAAYVYGRGGYLERPTFKALYTTVGGTGNTSGISAERSIIVHGGKLIAEAYAGSKNENGVWTDPSYSDNEFLDTAINIPFSSSHDTVRSSDDYEIRAASTSHWNSTTGWGTHWVNGHFNVSISGMGAADAIKNNLVNFSEQNFVTIDPTDETYYTAKYVDAKGREHECKVAYPMPIESGSAVTLGNANRQMWYDMPDGTGTGTYNYKRNINVDNDVAVIIGNGTTLNANKGISVRSYYPSGSTSESDYYYENFSVYGRSIEPATMGKLNATGGLIAVGSAEYNFNLADPLSTSDKWDVWSYENGTATDDLTYLNSNGNAFSGGASGSGYDYKVNGGTPYLQFNGTDYTFFTNGGKWVSFVFTAPVSGTYTLDCDIVYIGSNDATLSIDTKIGGNLGSKVANFDFRSIGTSQAWINNVQSQVGALNLDAGDKVCIRINSWTGSTCKINKIAIDGPDTANSSGIGGYTIEFDGRNYNGYNTVADIGNVYIHGCDITAVGAYSCAGIGGGTGSRSYNETVGAINAGGMVVIYGGNVNATGGSAGAGIGGGYLGQIQNVSIYGGNVTAIGGDSSSGIGGGYDSTGRAGAWVRIKDTVVYAYGGSTRYDGYWNTYPQNGIGYGSHNNISVDFKGGINISNAVVYTSGVFDGYADENEKYDDAIIFIGENKTAVHEGETYDNIGEKIITLSYPTVLDSGDTLTILKDFNFSIDSDGSLTNNGTVYIDYGAVWVKEQLSGDIRYQVVNEVTNKDLLSVAAITSHSNKDYAVKDSTLTLSTAEGNVLNTVSVLPSSVTVTNSGLRTKTLTMGQPVKLTGNVTSFSATSKAEAGTDYNALSSGANSVTILENGTFTVNYTPNYFYSELAFHFSQTLPEGTMLTLVDLCHNKAGNVYYYKVPNAGASSVSVSSFKKMGTNTAYSSDSFCGIGNASVQLVGMMPRTGASYTSMTVNIKHGSNSDSGVTVNLNNYTSGTVSFEKTEDVNSGFKGNVVVSNLVTSGNALAVELLDSSGSPISYNPGVVIKLGNNAPAALRNGSAFFANVGNGTHALSVEGLISGSYKLKISVCENTVAKNPMNEDTGTVTSNTISVTQAPAVKPTLTSGNRIVDMAQGATLNFDVATQGVGTLAVECLTKNNGSYSATTAITATISGSTVTVNVPANTTAGTYRINFKYGGAVKSYNIIVDDPSSST